MSSIILGYNYDIFISYRQKDNKGDRWVSEFVDSLKTELESTFKEEISVYFDINPHDGLLETHDVDESLKEKLKCLVFIPIISRTYCDPKSFAWEHEFKAFVEQASKDQFGLKVKLPNGNVAGRVLPVRINDLDISDTKLCESILGGIFRGIDFIYKEPGVNRPLRSNEDNPHDNLNHTIYRNQINKVANAIKEILSGLRKEPIESISERKEALFIEDKPLIKEKSIAVLPFRDMSPEKDQDYFCEGITEEIINALAHIENFKVIARSSAFAFKDKQVDIREIGSILDVETLLEGSIRKADNKLRITAQLIKVADGSHIWSERYDREMKDVFVIQEEISLAIADNLKIKLLGESRALITKRHSENLEAYNLYLKGTYCWQMLTLEGFKKASEYFEQALQKNPDYAIAYIGLANTKRISAFFGNIPPNEAFPKMNEYVNNALKIDSTLAEAYSILGSINTYYYWDWKEAERNFKQALQLNPNSILAHIYYSFLLTFTDRHENAIYEAKRAQELDPLSPFINTHVGVAFYYTGQYDRAIEEYRMSLTINPNYFLTHYKLGEAYWAKAMIKEAISEYEKAVELSDSSPIVKTSLMLSYYSIGKEGQAEKLFYDLKKRSGTEYIPASTFALIYGFRGEEDLALEWLKRACNDHDTYLPWLRANPLIIPEGSKYLKLLKDVGMDY
jgi:TolB-like protein/Tfp pilus assembly protein PilF